MEATRVRLVTIAANEDFEDVLEEYREAIEAHVHAVEALAGSLAESQAIRGKALDPESCYPTAEDQIVLAALGCIPALRTRAACQREEAAKAVLIALIDQWTRRDVLQITLSA